MDAAERVPASGGSFLGLDTAWLSAVERVLADPSEHRLLFQPIVDIVHGTVVAYEALSRFSGPPVAPPNEWFHAAARAGRGAELEALVLSRALRARATLPRGTFLSLNASPGALLDPDVFRVFTKAGDLSRTVIELTEHDAAADYVELREGLERLREAGALLAVDYAGGGYASLKHILSLRPHIVKVDRVLVEDVDRDEAKAAVVEMFGSFAGQIDARVLAEGVERPEELDTLIRLRVPLAQGFLFGRPSDPWASVSPEHVERIVRRVEERREDLTVATVLEDWPSVGTAASAESLLAAFEKDPQRAVLPIVDGWARPMGLAARATAAEGRLESLPVEVVKVTSPVTEVARRAMARPPERRFDPVACIDASGSYAGMIPVERLVQHLAR